MNPVREVKGATADALWRAFTVAQSEVRYILRDRRMLGLALFSPVVLFALFGFAINTDVRGVPVAVVDADGSESSGLIASHFAATPAFRPAAPESPGAGPLSMEAVSEWAKSAMRRERLRGLVYLPSGLGASLLRGESPRFAVRVDGSEPNTARVVLASCGQAASRAVMQQIRADLARAGTPPANREGPFEVTTRTMFNPQLKSTVFIVPGLVGIVVMIAAILLPALSVAREREESRLDQLACTPLRRWEFVTGKLVPYVGVVAVQVAFVMLAAWLLFGVGVQGSAFELIIALLLFAGMSLALGVFLSTFSPTQEVAMILAYTTALLPGIILSNLIFPVQSMPAILRWASHLVPLRHFLAVIRGIMIRGSGLESHLPELGLLCGFTLLFLSGSAVRLRRLRG